jgi:hypothetical protein
MSEYLIGGDTTQNSTSIDAEMNILEVRLAAT